MGVCAGYFYTFTRIDKTCIVLNFRTSLSIPPAPFAIDYDARILLVGSCFANNIGDQLLYHKWNVAINPVGIVFHPRAIAQFFSRVCTGTPWAENDLFFHQGKWHCWEVHSQFSHRDKNKLLERLNKVVADWHQRLSTVTHCVITLGTAWGYRYKKTGQLVANCHKVPQVEFEKELILADEITLSLHQLIRQLRQVQPAIKILFTISPVRHLKDGFVENQVSKAQLITALYQLQQDYHGTDAIYYFPAYEIVHDELRDYRFYAEDMLHPNATAKAYIWKRFVASCISPSTQTVMEEVAKIQKSLLHRPFDEQSEPHQKFLAQLNRQIEMLQKKHPHLRF